MSAPKKGCSTAEERRAFSTARSSRSRISNRARYRAIRRCWPARARIRVVLLVDEEPARRAAADELERLWRSAAAGERAMTYWMLAGRSCLRVRVMPRRLPDCRALPVAARRSSVFPRSRAAMCSGSDAAASVRLRPFGIAMPVLSVRARESGETVRGPSCDRASPGRPFWCRRVARDRRCARRGCAARCHARARARPSRAAFPSSDRRTFPTARRWNRAPRSVHRRRCCVSAPPTNQRDAAARLRARDQARNLKRS